MGSEMCIRDRRETVQNGGRETQTERERESGSERGKEREIYRVHISVDFSMTLCDTAEVE